jgi:hypothetical protein
MTTPATDNRASRLLEEIMPELLKMLEQAPEYGACGIELVFRDSNIDRISTKKEVLRKRWSWGGTNGNR